MSTTVETMPGKKPYPNTLPLLLIWVGGMAWVRTLLGRTEVSYTEVTG